MPDFTFKQGDAGPVVTDTLTFSDGTVPPLAGATVTFQMRSMTQATPLTLTGTTTVTNAAAGSVQFSPTVADTSQPAGAYMAVWNVVYSSGQTQTFPTQGYLWGVIEPSLANEPQQLVSLPDIKDYIGMAPGDRTHDAKLLRYVSAATALVENITGPQLVRTFDEWHQGGQYWIRLRHRPSFGMGSNPVLTLMAVDEYRGPVKYALSVVAEPTQAGIYSVMLDARMGTIYRRTTGGGVIPFGAGPWGGSMPDAVHVLYQAGQSPVPWSVQEAVLETVRHNYQTTMAVGRGSLTLADTEAVGMSPGFYMPRSALELLAPLRRHPAIA